jgi:hypothetical protein
MDKYKTWKQFLSTGSMSGAALSCGLSGSIGKGTSAMSTVVAVYGVSSSVWAVASTQTPTGRRRWLVRRRSAPVRRMRSARCSGWGCQRGWVGYRLGEARTGEGSSDLILAEGGSDTLLGQRVEHWKWLSGQLIGEVTSDDVARTGGEGGGAHGF